MALLQAATEMAAPLCIENTNGHPRRGPRSECGWKYGDSGAGVSGQKTERVWLRGGQRAKRAHEALPHTPPGGAPPETPGPPFPSVSCCGREGICQGFASRAQTTGAPLTNSLPSEEFSEIRERGPVSVGAA